MEEKEFNLMEVVYIFWKRKLTIVCTMLICLILGGLFAQFIAKPKYEEKATLLLLKDNTEVEIPTVEVQVNYNQRLVATYIDLATADFALKEVIDNLNLDNTPEKLKKQISVTATANSELILVTVEDKDKKLATDIANEISKVLIKNIEKIYGTNYLIVIDEAKPIEEDVNKEYLKYMLIFVGLGLCIDIFAIVVSEKWGDIKKSYTDVKNRKENKK